MNLILNSNIGILFALNKNDFQKPDD